MMNFGRAEWGVYWNIGPFIVRVFTRARSWGFTVERHPR